MLQLSLEPVIRRAESCRGRHSLQQPGVIQHGRVVKDGGDRLAAPPHNGHGTFRIPLRQREGASLGVHELAGLRNPVPHLERGIAESPRQLASNRPRASLVELDHEIGHLGPFPRMKHQSREQARADGDQNDLVREQGPTADGDSGEEASDSVAGEHQAESGSSAQGEQARPARRSHRSTVTTSADGEEQQGEGDRRSLVPPDPSEEGRRVAANDGSALETSPWAAGRIREQEMHQGPAVDENRVRRHPRHECVVDSCEVPEEPRESRRHHQEGGGVAGPPFRSDQPATDERPTHKKVGNPVQRVVPTECHSLRRNAEDDCA